MWAWFLRSGSGGPSAWSVGNVHADGLGILVKGLKWTIRDSVDIVAGRAMFVDLDVDLARFRVINVYGPMRSGRRLVVFRELNASLNTSRRIILAGDFNVSLDGGGTGSGGLDYSARALAELVRDYALVDTFRAAHPGAPGFTWRNSRGAASRLDYVFVGKETGGVLVFGGSMSTYCPP